MAIDTDLYAGLKLKLGSLTPRGSAATSQKMDFKDVNSVSHDKETEGNEDDLTET